MDKSTRDRRAQITHAMDLLLAGLGPFVEREIGVNRLDQDERLKDFKLGTDMGGLREKRFRDWDVPSLLNLMNYMLNPVFKRALSRTAQGHVKELQDVRVFWAHQEQFSEGDTNRALDTTTRFLHAIGANDQAEEVTRMRADPTPASSPKLIDARDRKPTRLHYAAAQIDDPAVVEALIAGGADLKARDEVGLTPLHHAAVHNTNPEVVEALIAGGADPNAKAVDDTSPLHLAAFENNPAVVEALIAGGADPKARDKAGRLPVDCAKDNEALQGTDAYRRLNEARFKE